MFVTNWNSTTKIQKISEITNFFRHYFLSRTEVYNAICDIFKRGDTALDNNYIERIQRYISLSRRNSMFFGSHEGAGRAAILYSIAISCKLNGINLFEYISDVIEKTIEWQPNTPLEKYRDLLPDRWKKQ